MTQVWYKEGKLHREGAPAVIYENGAENWYNEGKLHREDGPAVNKPDGTEYWYIEGKLNRKDGPAIVYKTKPKFRCIGDYEIRGEYHSINAEAIFASGETWCFLEGLKL